MRLLILGGDGMFGHKAYQVLHERFDTYVSLRESSGPPEVNQIYAGLEPSHALRGLDALDSSAVANALNQVKPEAVINCIGIVKQRNEAKHAIPSISINALFPHQLAEMCETAGIRLIHLSTDCVFSGARGKYTEEDVPDPVDLYGRSKLLGELDRRGCLTLRTSIIGWQLKHRTGLLEWFASQRGQTIKGFRKAIYTGLSTTVLAELVAKLLQSQQQLSGLYQVASAPTSKYDLLMRLRNTLGWHDISIEPDDGFRCDRSLIGSRFEKLTNWSAPAWPEMIAGLAAEWSTYEQWRHLN